MISFGESLHQVRRGLRWLGLTVQQASSWFVSVTTIWAVKPELKETEPCGASKGERAEWESERR